jgi:hypothetical protein
MSVRISGPFDVKITPQPADDATHPSAVGRMRIDKQFHGELDATTEGQMLAVSTEANGSAVYVAVEHVTGSLNGRTGTFVLMHAGSMTSDARQLSVTVAPASGTGELAGLSGSMNIIIADGKHSYEFDYVLPNVS